MGDLRALRRLIPVVQLFVSHFFLGPDVPALVLNSFQYTQAPLRYVLSGQCQGFDWICVV